MSDNTLKLIPASPAYLPGEAAVDAATAALRKLLPLGNQIEITVTGQPRFIVVGRTWNVFYARVAARGLQIAGGMPL